MATYDIKRCPSCNLPYEKNFYSGKPKAEEKIKYGSPIIVCKSCGHEFLDKEYIEIAIDGIPDQDSYKRFTPGTFLYTIASLAMAFFSYLFDFSFLPILFVLFALIIFGSDILSYEKRQAHIKEEINLSRERLGDKEYVEKLRSYGYQIPTEFLS